MAQESKSNAPLQEGEVRPKDDVTVYGLDGAKNMETGKPYVVHKSLAEKLVANGKATYDAPKESKTAKKAE